MKLKEASDFLKSKGYTEESFMEEGKLEEISKLLIEFAMIQVAIHATRIGADDFLTNN